MSVVSVLLSRLRLRPVVWAAVLLVSPHGAALAAAPEAAAGAAPVVTQALAPVEPAHFDGDVRDLPQVARPQPLHAWNEWQEPPTTKPDILPGNEPAEEPGLAVSAPAAAMPAPSANFAGLSFNEAVTGGRAGGGWPPDVNGDVGPHHYIEAVNDTYAIYSKTGTRLAAFTENALWSGAGSGTPCDAKNTGDPVVLHDGLADRWILTNFAFGIDSNGNPTSPFYQCFAVSKTADPVAGGWYLYAVRMDPGGAGKPDVGTLNDYGKFGLWTDCLYMAANEFTMPAGTFAGAAFASFSRSDMYAGRALTSSLAMISTNSPFTMIPANLLGTKAAALPPAGTPAYFVSESQSAFAFEVRKFTPGANCGAGGTLGAAASVSQTAYSGSGPSVAQPGTTNTLDTLYDRLMQKVQYRRIGTQESLWVVHNVATSTTSTIRPQWAQINVTGGTVAPAPVQQQIYAPDTTMNRWMASLAVDGSGNMALGYSRGNASTYPGIAYAGRLATDTLGTLPQAEVVMQAGAGSQSNSCGGAPCQRWGDYTAMSLDPADDCTFWYINEYYSSTSNGASGNWQTRIGAFKFPTCSSVGVAAKLAFSVQPVNTAAGATVTPAVKVQVQDSNGQFVSDSTLPITLALGSNPGGSTLAGTLTVNAVGGVATFANVSLNKTGSGYTLVASSSGLTAATSATFAITPGAASKLAFAQPPGNGTAGVALSPAVTVQVRDANDNLVTGSAAAITLAIGSNPGGSTLAGAGPVNASAGVASFPAVVLNKAASGYTLTASSSGLTGATSTTFAIAPGAASKLAFAQQPSNGTAGVALSPAVTVQVRDAFDNLVTSSAATVALALGANPGGSNLAGTVSASASAGVATFANLSLNKAASGYTLSAASSGLGGATSAPFAIAAAGAAQLVFTAQPANVPQGNRLGTVAVTQEDSFGNVVTTAGTVAFGLTVCGAPLNLGSAALSNGVATLSGSSVRFYTLASGLKVAATLGALSAPSAGFGVVANPDFVFADGVEACRP